MNFEFGKIFRDKPLRERAAGQCRPGVWIEHIPVAYLEDIGRVAVAWTFLELALQRIAWTCAGIQERHGLCFTGHAGVRHLQDTALGLVRRELPQSPPAKSLAVLSKRLGKLRRLRNSIVHGRVYCFADPARSFRQHVRGGAGKTQIETHPVLPNDFDAAVTQIVDATKT
ncbi:MAG: hypothetical protein VCE74_15545 [Alphaproteobacteria bacterium]|jgi:hypothetical protein